MAIKLIANYSKRLGLPGFSSHQFSISVEAELNNTDDVKAEASRLYRTLQSSVDSEIQATGFVPSEGYGTAKEATPLAPEQETRAQWPRLERNTALEWKASEKQRDLILKIITENGVDHTEVESLALEMFSISKLETLNKLQASGLIDELLSRYGKSSRRGTTPAGRFNGRTSR